MEKYLTSSSYLYIFLNFSDIAEDKGKKQPWEKSICESVCYLSSHVNLHSSCWKLDLTTFWCIQNISPKVGFYPYCSKSCLNLLFDVILFLCLEVASKNFFPLFTPSYKQVASFSLTFNLGLSLHQFLSYPRMFKQRIPGSNSECSPGQHFYASFIIITIVAIGLVLPLIFVCFFSQFYSANPLCSLLVMCFQAFLSNFVNNSFSPFSFSFPMLHLSVQNLSLLLQYFCQFFQRPMLKCGYHSLPLFFFFLFLIILSWR